MTPTKLRIIHCFRNPVGGIFRHVRDLVEIQNNQGHSVGILCDSTTGGAYEDGLFEKIKPFLELGLMRIPMRRAITPGDALTTWRAYKQISKLQPDVLHSHGSKGGAYARLIGSGMRVSGKRVARLYCPHGGSIHYDASSLKGKLFFTLERMLERMSDRLIFVSEYERDGYTQKVGKPTCPTSLVYNGLRDEEFLPVKPKKDEVDFLYIGMMRDLKGPDIFVRAMAKLIHNNSSIRAHMVGDGDDKPAYVALCKDLGVSENITFHDAMPAREAFTLARNIVVPSRAESMPYIVLEAIAAQRNVIATDVGGINEIFAERSGDLVRPDDVGALAQSMSAALDNPLCAKELSVRADTLKERFGVNVMAKSVQDAYEASLASIGG